MLYYWILNVKADLRRGLTTLGKQVGKAGTAVTSPSGSSDAEHRGARAAMVVRYLVELVVKGELRPGDHIVEAAIAQELGLSKTPVREGIKLLPSTGLAVHYPFRGTFVRDLSGSFVDEVVSLRTKLEVFAGTLAIRYISDHDVETLHKLAQEMDDAVQSGNYYQALTIDVEYHTCIYRWSKHNLLLETWEAVLPRVEFVQSYSRLFARPLPPGHVFKQHSDLALALGSRNPATITEALKKHIELGPSLLRGSGRLEPRVTVEPDEDKDSGAT